jgi:hypothetical protein
LVTLPPPGTAADDPGRLRLHRPRSSPDARSSDRAFPGNFREESPLDFTALRRKLAPNIGASMTSPAFKRPGLLSCHTRLGAADRGWWWPTAYHVPSRHGRGLRTPQRRLRPSPVPGRTSRRDSPCPVFAYLVSRAKRQLSVLSRSSAYTSARHEHHEQRSTTVTSTTLSFRPSPRRRSPPCVYHEFLAGRSKSGATVR